MGAPANAGMVVIGNEILTGKIDDLNSPFLCKEMNILGVSLSRITTIGDEFEEIGRVVKEFSGAYTWVFTSGGIGPTHDDITIGAIAAAFDVEAVRHPKLESAIRRHYKGRMTEDHLLMALVPEGSELIDLPGMRHPQVQFRNIFILPGVPELFQYKFNAIKHHFRGQPVVLRELFMKADEGVIASVLRDADGEYPEVTIGSYPNFFSSDYSVKVTVESIHGEQVDKAVSRIQNQLEALSVDIVRVT